MFGFLRTILALMVMSYHLLLDLEPVGMFPVLGFYVISGYLMTTIMHESYGYTWLGRLSFAANRFLRLFPQYWAAAAVSIFLIAAFGEEALRKYHPSIFLPAAFGDAFRNIALAFFAWSPYEVNPRLAPSAWALTVEIFFYFLICLGASKTFLRVKIWLAASIYYVILTFVHGVPWSERYFPIAAASLPFAIGSSLYFLAKDEKAHSLYLRLGVSSRFVFLLILGNAVCFSAADLKLFDVGGYINLALFTALVYSLIKGGRIVNIDEKLDKMVGDFSYPVYLLHWQAGFFASRLLYGEAFRELSLRGLASYAVSVVAVFLLSFTLINVLDKPIQVMRVKIKANRKSGG